MQFPAHFPIASAQSNPTHNSPTLTCLSTSPTIHNCRFQANATFNNYSPRHHNNTISNHSHNITTHLHTNYTYSDHSIRVHKFSLSNISAPQCHSPLSLKPSTQNFPSNFPYSDHRIRATNNFQFRPYLTCTHYNRYRTIVKFPLPIHPSSTVNN